MYKRQPYGNWLIKELQPADGYLPNAEIYPVTVSENEQGIGFTAVNDRIPEIGTQDVYKRQVLYRVVQLEIDGGIAYAVIYG